MRSGQLLKVAEIVSCYIMLPEKAMAPHSSTFAWKIPGMAEPGGLWGRTESDSTEGN